jgi:signal transduction histidine kinase
LRTRIAIAFALVSAIVTVATGLVVYSVSRTDTDDRARTQAADRARIAARVYAQTGERVAGTVRRTETVPAPLRAAVEAGQVATYRWNTGAGGPQLYAGSPVPGSSRSEVYVVVPRSAEEQALADLRRTLTIAGLVAVLVSTLIGGLVATRLASRLRRAAAVASRVAGGDLDARIHAHGRDEVATLGAAVDDMADALNQRIVRERQFVADVSHELRTPLAGLVAAAGLLEESEAATMVRERTTVLRGLVEDLLEVLRLEDGAVEIDARTVELGALARHVVAGRAGVDVQGAGSAVTDPRRAERILVNLVENAIRHGAAPILVSITGRTITVADHGPGFTEAMLRRGTERFAVADAARGGGTGLGLAIAAGQAGVLGATLTLANRVEGGAVVTVVFPERPDPGGEAGA